MKRHEEQNFYGLLGVRPDASPYEINRAYREMVQLYHEDSLASYSFFSREEREEILTKLQRAYSTLMDEEKRSRYHQSFIDRAAPAGGDSPGDGKTASVPSDGKPDRKYTALEIRNELKAMASSNPLIQEILARDVLSGKDLKKIREGLGVSLEQVADMTKVRLGVLRAMEDDRFEKPPPRLFIKGYLKAYAQSIGLEPETVAGRYLKRMEGESVAPCMPEKDGPKG